jgi:signal transduction histidine kinase
MLCVYPGPPQDFIDNLQQSSEINKVILCTSSELAECKKDEIETIIQRAIDVVSVIEHAEETGWFLLSEAGELQDIFHPIRSPFCLRSVFEDGLKQLPWCLAQLNAGEAVLIPSLDNLPPAAEVDRQVLYAANVRSIAFLPSSPTSSRRTVLILLSTSAETVWSDGIVEQSILLENIFSNAYQRKLAEDSLSLLTVETLIEHRSAERELRRKQSEVGVLASLLIRSQEDERKRLSRELHDDIGQRLSLAASEAAVMASQQSNATPIPADRINALRDELDRLCSDIHEMSHSLHSYKLQHLGLKSALKDMCDRFSRPDFSVDLCVEDMEDPVSKEVSLCLYRIAQESLNNALKHAHAPAAAVVVTKLQGKFYMTIQDSGIGFDSQTSCQGLGLISMNERLRGVNGQFRLNSVPGHGTEIWVEVPDQPDPLLARAS